MCKQRPYAQLNFYKCFPVRIKMKSALGLFLFVFYLSCTTEEAHGSDLIEKGSHYRLRLIKRESQGNIGPNEGQSAKEQMANPPTQTPSQQTDVVKDEKQLVVKKTDLNNTVIVPLLTNMTTPEPSAVVKKSNATVIDTKVVNATVIEKTPTINLNNPGVLKRGIIVFGTFTLFAVIYYIFYRRKTNKNEANNAGSSDNNQFRYGVLQSDDRRDNLELSRIPLTIESDEDDDEDLEVFDIEDRRKNLKYVNLQSRDIDIVNPMDSNNKQVEGDNLLLDIDDGSPDTSMDWMHSGSKSIL